MNRENLLEDLRIDGFDAVVLDFTEATEPIQRNAFVLTELLAQVSAGDVVIEAPPGAGKTTVVPMILLERGVLGAGEILVLQPRRLAARLSAQRCAALLGERVGERVGYRVRTLHGLAHDIVREKPGMVGLEERFGAAPQVPMEEDLALPVEDAQVHGLGVQIDPAVVLVAFGVESHGSLLKRFGLLVQPAYSEWGRRRRGPE